MQATTRMASVVSSTPPARRRLFRGIRRHHAHVLPMSRSPDILAEIKSQLQDDILHFGWLCQIARDLYPSFTDSEIVGCVTAAVTHLAKDRAIVVGDATESDGVVQIQPWTIEQEKLPARLTETVTGSKDREFCFWIQLTKHYAAS